MDDGRTNRCRPSRSGEVASELESLGYAAMWVPEAWGREAFTNAGLMLSATSSMVIATGIANIWARDAVADHNAAKTLNAAYDDRFVLGLGVSHQPLVERLRGHDYVTPVEAMRDYLTAMDAAPMFAPEGHLRYATGHRGARSEDARSGRDALPTACTRTS